LKQKNSIEIRILFKYVWIFKKFNLIIDKKGLELTQNEIYFEKLFYNNNLQYIDEIEFSDLVNFEEIINFF
jgi:hypothetical protein